MKFVHVYENQHTGVPYFPIFIEIPSRDTAITFTYRFYHFSSSLQENHLLEFCLSFIQKREGRFTLTRSIFAVIIL